MPDLPAEVKPPNRLKYYNLELKLKIKNDRESRRKVEAAAKRRYSSLGYGLPQVRDIKVRNLNDLNLTFQFSFRLLLRYLWKSIKSRLTVPYVI